MRVKASSIGPIAKRALQQSRSAKVMACFDHSFYLEVDAGLICVVDACLHDGPLNLLVQMESRSNVPLGSITSVGERWVVEDGEGLRRGDGAVGIDFLTSSVWQPSPARMCSLNRANVSLGLELLRDLIADRSGPKGLIDIALDRTFEPRSPVEQAAFGPIRSMRERVSDWLESADIGLAEPVGALLGLGPGLTPSGDDLISGFLIAAHHVGSGDDALDLWKSLEDKAKLRTNQISVAHLMAAADGAGAAPLHDLLEAIHENRVEQIAKALDGIDQIGHSSGWDAVAGLSLLLEAWIETGKHQAVAA